MYIWCQKGGHAMAEASQELLVAESESCIGLFRPDLPFS